LLVVPSHHSCENSSGLFPWSLSCCCKAYATLSTINVDEAASNKESLQMLWSQKIMPCQDAFQFTKRQHLISSWLDATLSKLEGRAFFNNNHSSTRKRIYFSPSLYIPISSTLTKSSMTSSVGTSSRVARTKSQFLDMIENRFFLDVV